MEEKKYIITVGRQYGCGGRELAEILAEKLGVHLYDRQIVHLAAAKLGISLGEKAESIHILPGSYLVKDGLKLSGTKILMKSGKKIADVKRELLLT